MIYLDNAATTPMSPTVIDVITDEMANDFGNASSTHSLGRKARIWRLDRGLMEGVARLGTFLHLPLDSGRLAKLTEDYVVSNAKIKRALGVERLPVRARDGLLKTVKSFRPC